MRVCLIFTFFWHLKINEKAVLCQILYATSGCPESNVTGAIITEVLVNKTSPKQCIIILINNEPV